MSDRDIVKAIFDSYLTGRKGHMRGWNDFELGGNVAPKSPEVASKLQAIRTLVSMMPEANAVWSQDYVQSDLWLKFLFKCKEFELVEEERKTATRGKFFGLGALVSGEEARLGQAISAARTFIIAKMTTEPAYKTSTTSDLDDEISDLRDKKSIAQDEYNSLKAARHPNLNALSEKEAELKKASSQYDALVQGKAANDHIKFFNTFTKIRDKRVDMNNQPLKEATFGDFCVNVNNSKRKTLNLDKLMSTNDNLPTPSGRTANTMRP
jgi:hypothetical protein